ncbi:MAG: hypothetical protein GX639_05470 [Fibrobacter sp.]|nr:hypothetical protein [Fibrobacter sp.]
MRKSSPVKERIYSGWKLYTSADSIPVQIMAGVDTTLYASAHFSGEDHSSAIAKITFATGKTTLKSFNLKNNGVSFLSFPDIRNITSNGTVLVANSISEAVSGITSSIQTVVIKKDSADIVYYTVYTHITNMSTLPDLSYNIAIPADPPAVPAKKILAEGKIAIAPDNGLENILSTTTLLTRLPTVNGPDTLNPLYQTTFGSIGDSLQVKLLFSILFHEAVAHNSPKASETEENAGIFTNYIQYFDNVVRSWARINDFAVGLPRIRTIFRVIKERNAVLVADNVWSLNHGTLAEFGKPIQERKNYAFFEGYSRLLLNLTQFSHENLTINSFQYQ